MNALLEIELPTSAAKAIVAEFDEHSIDHRDRDIRGLDGEEWSTKIAIFVSEKILGAVLEKVGGLVGQLFKRDANKPEPVGKITLTLEGTKLTLEGPYSVIRQVSDAYVEATRDAKG